MNKKISLFIIMLLMIPTVFLAPTKKVSAIDLDDASNIADQIWSLTKDEVLTPVVKTLAGKVLNKITSDTINWANNGFDGDPGFVNNWDDYLKGTEHEVLSDALNSAKASESKIKDIWENRNYSEIDLLDCQVSVNNEFIDFQDEIDAGDPLAFYTTQGELDTAWDSELQRCEDEFGDQVNPTTIAQQNHELNQSGELDSSRSVIETVAKFGSDKLNKDTLNSIIKGEGDTLNLLLGSKAKKEQFKSDITVGGWEGYLALADPHNYDAGLDSLITGALGSKTTQKVNSVVQNIQTPVKVLDKKRCVEYSDTEKDSNGSSKCLREEVTTPGAQITAKLNEALLKDQKDPSFYSDALIGPLVSAIGRLSDGLLKGGLSKLTSTATNSFFSPEKAKTTFSQGGNNYQSQYDVLGIKSNPSDEIINSVSTTPNGGGSSNIFGDNIDTSFIGGPENLDNSTWSTGPQIIINLQENLVKNINLASEEITYYKDAADILDNSQNTAINLDRCLPGPDYAWESRYKDAFDINGNDEDKLGLSETKDMVNDPLVNIPGSEKMRTIFDQLLGGTRVERIQIDQRTETLKSLLLNLKFTYQKVEENFLDYKNQLNMPSLVLTTADWNNLDTSAQKEAVKNAFDGFVKLDGSSSAGYLSIKEEEGETLDTLILNKPDQVREAVLNMAWDIWRDKTSKEDKEDVRYAYYIEQNNLSNQEFIARAKANLNRINAGAIESEKILSDCLVLKSYALGTPVSDLRNIIAGSSQNSNSAQQVGVNNLLYKLNPALAIGNIFGLFGGGGGGFTFIQVPQPYRTNEDIKNFLTTEYAKINDNNPSTESVFITNVIASPAAINNSILGFNNDDTETVSIQINNGTETTLPDFEDQEFPKREAYFQKYYPDYGFKSIQQNAYEIKDMFMKDRFYSSFSRARGERGILYCRNPRVSDLQRSRGLGGDDDSDFQPECIRNKWYAASNLDYETIFAGI